jgi:hypothetical protein
MNKKEIADDEIIYEVTKRSLGYLIFGDIAPATLLILLGYLLLFNINESSITSICIGTILLLIGIYFLFKSLLFKQLTIYKDRIVIDKLIFGSAVINIDDIKDTHYSVGGYMAFVYIYIYTQKPSKRYCITALYDNDMYEIATIIKNLKKEKTK